MDEFTTRSIFEAAFLHANGIPLNAVIDQGKGTQFVFDNKDNVARRASHQFYEDFAMPARSLFKSLGDLKRESYQARQASGQ